MLAIETGTQLLDGDWDSWHLTPGVIDDQAVSAFTEGHCASLAVAVRRITGWRIGGLRDSCSYASKSGVENGYVHIFNILSSGSLLDINGPCSASDMVRPWRIDVEYLVLDEEGDEHWDTEFAEWETYCPENPLVVSFAQLLVDKYAPPVS